MLVIWRGRLPYTFPNLFLYENSLFFNHSVEVFLTNRMTDIFSYRFRKTTSMWQTFWQPTMYTTVRLITNCTYFIVPQVVSLGLLHQSLLRTSILSMFSPLCNTKQLLLLLGPLTKVSIISVCIFKLELSVALVHLLSKALTLTTYKTTAIRARRVPSSVA